MCVCEQRLLTFFEWGTGAERVLYADWDFSRGSAHRKVNIRNLVLCSFWFGHFYLKIVYAFTLKAVTIF